MAKLIIGVLILALILTGSIISTEYLEVQIEEICTDVENSAQLPESGHVEMAEGTLENALQKWLGMESYVASMLHSSKVELISETFYDYIDALQTSESSKTPLKDKLVYLLQSMLKQERISLGSIM